MDGADDPQDVIPPAFDAGEVDPAAGGFLEGAEHTVATPK
ncbi:hypothetical protein FHS42_006979 [Streptomyces zagrosensis]|uniref:Uncharacterized protein n=1 Tax=Streptomyces zagrosensis TaxID=1042984 RepID=A0A7W9QGK2_9ACTN|nr:hypothetical protein [Streptomyces zagrosensis]